MGNWQYVISDDPVDFKNGKVNYYNNSLNGQRIDMGFACEIVQHNDRWYRSGTMGERDHWRLGFTEIAWDEEGAFHIVQPSRITHR